MRAPLACQLVSGGGSQLAILFLMDALLGVVVWWSLLSPILLFLLWSLFTHHFTCFSTSSPPSLSVRREDRGKATWFRYLVQFNHDTQKGTYLRTLHCEGLCVPHILYWRHSSGKALRATKKRFRISIMSVYPSINP